jgi:hypothetical protein
MVRRLAALSFLIAAAVSAQPRSVEVFGLGGYGRVAGDEGWLGNGFAAAGAIQAPFTRRVALDFDVAWTYATRDFGAAGRFENDQVLVTPSLVYRWGSERTYAFAGGGAGYETREGDDGMALNAKAGVVTVIRGGLLFRADFVSAWRYVLPHVQVRAGIGYRF